MCVCAAKVSQAGEDDMSTGNLEKLKSTVSDAFKGNATNHGDSGGSPPVPTHGGNMAGELHKHHMTALSRLRHVLLV